MKNVILQGETYHFRIVVPSDCVEGVGKKEISKSLRTKDPLAANKYAEPLRKQWKATFKKIRTSSTPLESRTFTPAPEEEPIDYYQGYHNLMERNLPALFDRETSSDLHLSGEFFMDCAAIITTTPQTQFELPELELRWPLPSEGSPGKDRKRNQALVVILKQMHQAVVEELGEPLVVEDIGAQPTAMTISNPTETSANKSGEETDLLKVAELLIQSKTRADESNTKIRSEVRHLKEWTKGKSEIFKYTKSDLIDYVQNCLPNIPSNISRKKAYAGKSLRTCVALTQKDPTEYPPLAYKTCENNLMRLQMVFNYAKNDLGVISVNPSKGVEISQQGSEGKKPKGYTPDELNAMWAALKTVYLDIEKRPSRYWVPILCLYHGFRLNEACNLFLKDVHEDDDGIFVMDLNIDGNGKTLKNKGSARLVPVHPFVLEDLGFREFVQSQKESRTKGVLFSDLVLSKGRGYRRRVSNWYPKWKETWLPEESMHKHAHDLRYTFIQQAQNQAKMSDRCSQEITGHAVEGVSAVHLGYSGRLKPKDVLEELQKLEYDWEKDIKEKPLISLEHPTPRKSAKPKKRRIRKKPIKK